MATSRKLAAFGLDQRQAFADLQRLGGVWTPVLPAWVMLDTAKTLMSTGNLSFWDALIGSACRENGIQIFTRKTLTLLRRL